MGKRKIRYQANPPKFRAEVHIPLLHELFSAGQSLATYCVAADIVPSTFYHWLDLFPEFEQAYEKANTQAQMFWENLAMNNIVQSGFNFSLWSSVMRNRFNMTEHRKLKVKNIAKENTAVAKYHLVMQEVSNGNLTGSELNQLVNAIATGVKIEEATDLKNKVEELERSVKEQQQSDCNYAITST